jgi:hypothetical protein
MALRLNESGVSAVLPLGGLPECMETALTAFSSGPVRQPGREIIEAGWEFLRCRTRVFKRSLAK